MRGFGRWLLNALTVLSLLLCVATLAISVTSLTSPVDLSRWYRDGRGEASLAIERGAVEFWAYDRPPNVGDSFGFTRTRSWAGVRVRQAPGVSPRNRQIGVSVPLWLVLASALPAPMMRGMLWWRRRAGRRRRRHGLCPSCSYDLTGNVSGVCPECGTRVTG